MNEKLLRRIYSSPVDGFTVDLGAVVGISELNNNWETSDYIRSTSVNLRVIGITGWVEIQLSRDKELTWISYDTPKEEKERRTKIIVAEGENELRKLIQVWRES